MRWTVEDTRSVVITVALCAAAALALRGVRFRLEQTHHYVKETTDVYVLPPPDQVVKLSLGYRSALADLLWAHVLVSQGLHTWERRRFDNLSLFLDSINELEPTFREPYMMADALYTFQGGETPHDEVLRARAVMERGTRELPLDGDVWLAAGQFIAYIAPGSYLTDPIEQEEWRNAGADMLLRAGILSGDNNNRTWGSLAAAGILTKAGRQDASIAYVQRQIAAVGDPELISDPERAEDARQLKATLERLLAKQAGEKMVDVMRQHVASVDQMRRADVPWVSVDRQSVMGPPVDAAACSGPDRAEDLGCARTWRERSPRAADPFSGDVGTR